MSTSSSSEALDSGSGSESETPSSSKSSSGGSTSSSFDVEVVQNIKSNKGSKKREKSWCGDVEAGSIDPLVHPAMTLTFDNVHFCVKTSTGERCILQGVSGFARPGEMIALLGPSGAGKSSLLNVLAGRVTSGVTGSVTVNGGDVNSTENRRHTAYIMQDDSLLGALTVRENLEYSADLSIDSSVSNAEKAERVDKVITDLGLDRVADSKVGNVIIRGVSGGERRRVSIGIELVSSPALMFLDEPTSGLDSTASFHVMSMMRDLARTQQRTIVASIHQPSSATFGLFDRVLFLTGGSTAYFGTVENIPTYLENALGEEPPPYVNLADHMLDKINDDFINTVTGTKSDSGSDEYTYDIVSVEEDEEEEAVILPVQDPIRGGNAPHVLKAKIKSDVIVLDEEQEEEEVLPGQAVANYYAQSDIAAANQAELNELLAGVSLSRGGDSRTGSRYARGVAYQTMILTKRSLLNAIRYFPLYWIRIAMYLMLALMMGLVWFDLNHQVQERIQDRFGLFFFSTAFLAFMSISAAPALIEDRIIAMRERANSKYGTLAYFLAKTIVSSIFVAIIAISFSLTLYWMSNLDPKFDKFLIFTLNIYLALLVAEGIVTMFSSFTDYMLVSLAASACVYGAAMIFQGYYVKTRNIPAALRWVRWWSFQRFSFEVSVVNDMRNRIINCEVLPTGDCFCLYQPSIPGACSFTGEDVLRELDYQDVEIWEWFLVLTAQIIIYRFFVYLGLRFKPMRF